MGGFHIPIKIGTKIGKAQVMRVVRIHGKGPKYVCKCPCGNEYRLSSTEVRRNKRRRCPECYYKTTRNTELRDKIVKLRKMNKPVTEISRLVGVSRERVCQYLRPFGLSARRKFPSKAEILAPKIIDMVMEGYKNKEISLALHCSEALVGKVSAKFSEDRYLIRVRKLKLPAGIKFLGFIQNGSNHHRICSFQCSCGQEFTAKLYNVTRGFTKSCGCRDAAYKECIAIGFEYDKTTGKAKVGRNGQPIAGCPTMRK